MVNKGKILIVDDEKDIRFLLREILEDEGYVVAEAPHSEAAYAEITAHGMPDLVILDIWLENSDRDGMEILSDLKKKSKTLPVLMISGHGNIEMAVKAIKLGAYDFIEKPFNTDRLLHLVTRALESSRMRRGPSGDAMLIAHTADMQALKKAAQKAAQGDARVLVTGAWGAGRTHLARFIHQESGRAAKPCVSIASAGLEPNAIADILAGEGTVVFRDVQLMTAPAQAELLARLNAKPDARVMATALPELDAIRAAGGFLPDLYERLSVTTLTIPSLDDRRADMAELCQRLIEECFENWGVSEPVRVSDEAVTALRGMSWVGGQVSALRALCAMAALRMKADGTGELQAKHLAVGLAQPVTPEGAGNLSSAWCDSDLRTAREAFERWYFDQLMARFDGNVSQVAAFAGMDRTALHRKLKSLKDGDAEAA